MSPTVGFVLPRVVAWALFFTGINFFAQFLGAHGGQKWLNRWIKVDCCSLWAFGAAFFHLGVWLPAALAYLTYIHLGDTDARHRWFVGGWDEKGEMPVEAHIFISTIGYMVKDFYFCAMDAMICTHHAVCIITSLVVLFAPGMNFIGGTAASVCALEIGSLGRNAYYCFPNSTTAWFYIIAMQASNLLVSYWMIHDGVAVLSSTADYFTCFMSFALIVLRVHGCFTSMRATTIKGWRTACRRMHFTLAAATKNLQDTRASAVILQSD
jgi:hypothetical protein